MLGAPERSWLPFIGLDAGILHLLVDLRKWLFCGGLAETSLLFILIVDSSN